VSTYDASKHRVFRWTTLKGLVALFLFLIIAALAEYLIVLYATSLGLRDENPLQWSAKFPGTDWNITLAISPLFHLVPIAVIIALVASWTYLTRHVAVKPLETQKGKSGLVSRRGKEQKIKLSGKTKSVLSRINVFAYVGRKIRFARATIRSALIVLVVFSVFILAISLLTYPQLIYHIITNAYQNNPSLLDFIKGTGQAASSIGSVFSVINSALLAASPGFRDFVLGLGSLSAPLANLDNVGKYLVFQNAAAWISAMIVLLYGEYGRKTYQYRKK
jgi:hypothetical protein